MEKKEENIVQGLRFMNKLRMQGVGTISKQCMKFTIANSKTI